MSPSSDFCPNHRAALQKCLLPLSAAATGIASMVFCAQSFSNVSTTA